ncbi:hypothetical protein [uncultured Parasphingorhabdus sp.]|uniref:hypothetical protein n=1 Tax=uncultured Parasphingorhabdus sp. TaxID=2709694 RepID=UPI002AA60530|nr:hypothetical protein [uncultured Parasphingorhabdus sp.]
MKKLLLAFPAAVLLAAPASGGETIELTEKQQAKLDKQLEGRSPRKAQSCIDRNDQRKMTVISDDILIFASRRNAKTIYINKPPGGCPGADRYIMSYRRTTGSLCSGEIIQLIDNMSGATMGSCTFGDFVPYTKDLSVGSK